MIIGKNTETKKNVELDLQRLIATRLLIQANAGGGKSWLIRRLLEQSHGKVQQIVIDLEGEFSTLREKYDYLLVGKDGEIPANIQTAELLSRKLLMLNVSTIIDLSELKHHERITFVKRFLDSLVNAPRELWHPCLIVIDEAHQFCPEKTKSESASSVIDLLTRGRKRGFCGVLATQRIAKLHKDAAAECTNGFVGRTVMDIDRKRAGYDLGFNKKEQEMGLKKMEDGEFFGYGPAISKDDYVKVKVGDVNTIHPEPGKNILKSSKTPDNIKKLMKDVIDLPKEVQEELKTKQDMQKRISELKRDVRVLEQNKPLIKVDEKGLERAREQGLKQAGVEYEKRINVLEKTISLYQKKLVDVGKIVGQETPKFNELPKFNPKPIQFKPQVQKTVTKSYQESPIDTTNYEGEYNLNLCEKKLYSLLFQYSDRSFSKQQVGVFTGYSHRSGGFNNAISHLRQLGLIEGSGSDLRAKELNSDIAQEFDFSKEAIISKLNKCEKEIYDVLLKNPEETFGKEELAQSTRTEYSHRSGGFNNAISRLNTLGLMERTNGMIRLNPELLEI